MKIGVPAETRAEESRVAATPDTVKKLAGSGHHNVLVQTGAGVRASIPDEQFVAAGATIVADAAELYRDSDIVLKVRAPEAAEVAALKSGSILIGLLEPHDREGIERIAKQGVTGFALEALPRISRAQSMDVLSSQANIGGYKAVIIAADLYQRFFPMLMTAAGTVKAARVLVLGAGVAGLQAIATAKRLGAVVEAFDVRPAVKEQVESLGAKFVEVALSDEEKAQAETAGGYASEMSDDYKRRQGELIAERAKAADVVITTALIPGRPAPRLISAATVESMKPGSVIVDMAAAAGGNCELTEAERTVVKHGVHLVGITNLPGLVAADASALYARNVLTFLNLLVDSKTGELNLNREDEIIAGTLVCVGGEAIKKQ
ncbi:MAG TPA: Re/Si-specific NAD(P)(+) transhydrogenase subunit alpha [Burkholderiales bacterium]|jgi:NAD(P) transhydrogenase subunit alpha|nr:Re/Si-specific NAD(P)(+) transhydrogenase subunit alpha [Burkholderiales bacterium]